MDSFFLTRMALKTAGLLIVGFGIVVMGMRLVGATGLFDQGVLAYVAECQRNADIFLLDVARAITTPVMNSLDREYVPVWSPDGSRLAFVSDHNANPTIYVVNADLSNRYALTGGMSLNYTYIRPIWSNDGHNIAFLLHSVDGRVIYFLDGERVDQLPESFSTNRISPSNDIMSAQSVDGRRVQVFYTPNEIYILDSNRQQQRRLTQNDCTETYPRWQP